MKRELNPLAFIVGVLVTSYGVGWSSGLADIPLTALSVESSDFQIKVAAERSQESRSLSSLVVEWGGVKIVVPQDELRGIKDPWLSSILVLGHTSVGSIEPEKLQIMIVSMNFGERVQHYDGEAIHEVSGHVEFKFSRTGYNSRYVSVPIDGRANKWKLLEKHVGEDEIDQGEYIGVNHP